jgi:hypothetical protein
VFVPIHHDVVTVVVPVPPEEFFDDISAVIVGAIVPLILGAPGP